jgi:hypothetical protein
VKRNIIVTTGRELRPSSQWYDSAAGILSPVDKSIGFESQGGYVIMADWFRKVYSVFSD